ncbi:lipopolysaccharide-induced tumor necrosis factor-alpha factor homolog [Teleopsis dalmanni]|uniref:lipopolysaccharide-induced tumor necrosis factor-alpha factor homolog n=1 Tax=Teleopsis dalmanni TaxID=139649 RepID=UPI000D32D077|nr:lipopolysaccharide-induced tumor necrosis factor-alpha factor homolog [Teleopsis dalmanni]
MEEKHDMLYPPIESGANSMPHEQRITASASIGLPIEAPPSYDMAISSPNWTTPTAPQVSSIGFQPHQTYVPNSEAPTSAFVEQPISQQLPQILLPEPQPPQQQQFSTEPPKLGPNPCAARCPNCGTYKTTRMCYTPNSRTHLCALLLCLVGWCCCACCVPYCMNSCRTGNHYCTKCNTFLGSFNPHQGLFN